MQWETKHATSLTLNVSEGGLSGPMARISGKSQRRDGSTPSTTPNLVNCESLRLRSHALEAVLPAFRKIIPEIPSCKYDEKGNLLGPPRPVTQKHLEIFHVIRLDRENKLIGVHVARRFFKDCDGWGGSASDVWFFLEGNSQPRMISQQPQLDGWDSSQKLIDIGDFDGDGRIEALFWFSGYNEDGYVLYFDRFEKSAIFTWSYH